MTAFVAQAVSRVLFQFNLSNQLSGNRSSANFPLKFMPIKMQRSKKIPNIVFRILTGTLVGYKHLRKEAVISYQYLSLREGKKEQSKQTPPQNPDEWNDHTG